MSSHVRVHPCNRCGQRHLTGARLCVDQAVEQRMRRLGVRLPDAGDLYDVAGGNEPRYRELLRRELDGDRTPRVVGELRPCGCCVTVACPFCGGKHGHGVGPGRELLGHRRSDCQPGGEYELIAVMG